MVQKLSLMKKVQDAYLTQHDGQDVLHEVI